MALRIVHAQIGGANLVRHGAHVGASHLAVGEVKEVAHITGPAAEVRIGLRLGGIGLGHVIGDVQRTEDVTEVHLLAAGDGHGLDATQGHDTCAVGGILLAHIADEGSVLLTGEDLPVAVGVALHARAHEVEDKLRRVLAGVAGGVGLGIAVQHLEEGEQRGVVAHAGGGLSVHCGLLGLSDLGLGLRLGCRALRLGGGGRGSLSYARVVGCGRPPLGRLPLLAGRLRRLGPFVHGRRLGHLGLRAGLQLARHLGPRLCGHAGADHG